MIVVDASVLVDLLLGGTGEAGRALAERFRAGEVVCAPHLIDAEVGQVLRRYVLRGDLQAPDVESLIDALADLPVQRYPHTGLLGRAFQLRANVTIYDGLYLALAEVLTCPLLTGDRALAAVPGCSAVVVVDPR